MTLLLCTEYAHLLWQRALELDLLGVECAVGDLHDRLMARLYHREAEELWDEAMELLERSTWARPFLSFGVDATA